MENRALTFLTSTPINTLPNETIGQFLGALCVADRLRCETVSPRWNQLMWHYGWMEQRKLNYRIVFEGTRTNPRRFSEKSLIDLFGRVESSLIELDLHSFVDGNFHSPLPITSSIFGQISRFLPNLTTMNFCRGFDLSEVVERLPKTLLEIWFSGPFTERNLMVLADGCPNLEAIHFAGDINSEQMSASVLNAFLIRYPGLKKLYLFCGDFAGGNGSLTSIGSLNRLEEFGTECKNSLDDASFVAMVEGCSQLRKLYINTDLPMVSPGAYFGLAKMPNLVDISINSGLECQIALTNSAIKEVAIKGRLKKISIDLCASEQLTDDLVAYLIDHCKSLVELDVACSSAITEKSLTTVIAEVVKRHGTPPRALPNGSSDPGIFSFSCYKTGIDLEKAIAATVANPWIRIEEDLIEKCIEM